VQPWTFVHPGHLTAYLEARGPNTTEVYVGRVRNATSELAALAMMPHVAHEYGILMRSWCAALVGKDRDEFQSYLLSRTDFHTVRAEGGRGVQTSEAPPFDVHTPCSKV
jgi:hypothetical protein